MEFKFKYFTNVQRNARFIDEPCDNCGSTNLCLNGIYFDHYDEEVEAVCLECLTKGNIVVEIPSEVSEKIYNEISINYPDGSEDELKKRVNEIIEELSKTPPVPWVQSNDWQVCCGNFMTYLGELGRDDLDSMATDGDGKALLLNLIDEETKNRIDDLECLWNELGDYAVAYHFKCMKCGKQIVVIQSY
ncbi:CbrC family protein [Clostridium beijerinckii]|uniref:CbrC family protein n=1 Tax=Clostridium beijerinckii TaxID=1520 RepID=A0A1S8RG02_CLOBE|nr:CbrC family protein [Clostridium beijerinckii]NRY60177.1 uncharacterized protein CbrC (UPF0167 family) [Clostridium beijerinckii]OOM52160.1 hypothetical protein CLBCK_49290 [Clostridium beijerinckii]